MKVCLYVMCKGTAAVIRNIDKIDMVLQVVLKPTPEGKQNLVLVSRKVANAVTELVQSAEVIKGKLDLLTLCSTSLCLSLWKF